MTSLEYREPLERDKSARKPSSWPTPPLWIRGKKVSEPRQRESKPEQVSEQPFACLPFARHPFSSWLFDSTFPFLVSYHSAEFLLVTHVRTSLSSGRVTRRYRERFLLKGEMWLVFHSCWLNINYLLLLRPRSHRFSLCTYSNTFMQVKLEMFSQLNLYPPVVFGKSSVRD